MEYTNHLPVPVYSTDGHPIMPCHPAKARKLLAKGRAVLHHVRGIFGIRLLDRTRAECVVQDTSLQIDPGSDTSGFAVVSDDEQGQRTVLAAYELKHRAKAIKSTMHNRKSKRRRRRYRLRFRKPRFNNRKPKPGTLKPSVDSLRIDTLRLVRTLLSIYPITSISIERNKFDTQLMLHPNIKGVEYQHGTLFGWNVRSYIFDRDGSRCVYCKRRDVRLELDHVRPRAIGSNRVDNLIVSCKDCNGDKKNRPIEEFLADQPKLLQEILHRVERSNLTGAAHVNTALPAIIRELRQLGLPLALTNAAAVSWARQRLNIRKTHCYDAILQGENYTGIVSLPAKVWRIRYSNGRSKQKASVDEKGTPKGAPFRQQQRLPKHLHQRNPALSHSDRRQRHGPLHICSGDIVRLPHGGRYHTGRGTIKAHGTRIAITGSKPEISAVIRKVELIAHRPGYTIKWVVPSQQSHAKPTDSNPASNND